MSPATGVSSDSFTGEWFWMAPPIMVTVSMVISWYGSPSRPAIRASPMVPPAPGALVTVTSSSMILQLVSAEPMPRARESQPPPTLPGARIDRPRDG
ncbi:hypothetical protein [Streptomyces iranensis]|uniref:hypothetical protein n=1 Tax=Streptomyces iranensis TaxID=576784 RepID=UPI0039B787C4